jgi:hypothetical protein
MNPFHFSFLGNWTKTGRFRDKSHMPSSNENAKLFVYKIRRIIMASKTFLYISAGILFLIGLCLFGYGVLSVIGSTSAQGDSSWLTFGLGFGFVGVLFLAGGAGLVYAAMRGHEDRSHSAGDDESRPARRDQRSSK